MSDSSESPDVEPTPRPAELDPISQRLQSLQLQAGERRGGGGRKWGSVIALILLIGAGIGGYFGYEAYKKAQADELPETEAISFGERAGGGVILDVSGYIVPKNKVQIAPQAAGRIDYLPIEMGMKVKKDDIICRIDDESYKAEYDRAAAALALAEADFQKLKNGADPEEIDQAKSLLESATASLRESQDMLDRTKKLRETNAISQQELDAAIAKFEIAKATKAGDEAKVKLLERGARPEDILSAQAAVDQAKASLESARITLDHAIIHAPLSGTVLEKNAEEGELVFPQTVIKSLCVLADMSQLEAEVDIQEREVSRVAIGHPCQVIPDAYPDRIYEAELARMQPQVNRSRGVVPVKVKILSPDNYLLADMNCRVLFLKRQDQDENEIPTVPSRAVTTKDGVSTVFVLEKQAARLRRVKIGKTLGDEIQIVDGLKTGETVLLPGEKPIEDGMTIRAKLLDESKDENTQP